MIGKDDNDNLMCVNFDILEGLLIKHIEISEDKDQIDFITHNDIQFCMYHSQDCCESVSLEDICGDLEDLTKSPIIHAEESSDTTRDEDESNTWTFYKLSTNQGSVTLRWYGTSNGYYSEDVNFYMSEKSFKQAPEEDKCFMVLKHTELLRLI